jgi:hypothetical protein
MKQIILNADAMGFGDLCVTAFISEGSKGKETELIHWATGEKRKVLEMFGQKIASSNEGSINALSAYDIELSERGSLPRVLNRSYELGIFSEPKAPTVTISNSAKNWAAEQKKDYTKPLVMLFPETIWVPREWPAAYWIDLAWKLHASNFDVRLFTSDENKKFKNLPSFYWGQSWEKLAALMQLSLVVVGNDSGPVNIAGVLDVPTIALCGPTTASCFSHVPSVEVVTSSLYCTGCYFGEPFRAACDQGCRSLFMLEPEIVLTKIQRMAKPTNLEKIKKVLEAFN